MKNINLKRLPWNTKFLKQTLKEMYMANGSFIWVIIFLNEHRDVLVSHWMQG